MTAVVFIIAFATFALTAAPAVGWLDSSEFVAASAELGVPHSPGHPLQAFLGYLATWVPLGDVAIRVNLLSSALSAAAMATLYRALREVYVAISGNDDRVGSVAVATTTALAITFSAPVWMQAVRAEVYALELLLLCGALLAFVRALFYRRRCAVFILAIVLGIGLATHHFITLTVMLPMSAILIWRIRPSTMVILCSVGLGVVGLALFSYLPLRAATDPMLNWGNPDTLGRLLWTISGKAFAKSMAADHASNASTDAMQIVAALLIANPVLPLIAALGVYLSLRERRGRALLVAALSIAGLACAGRVLLGFDPETPDHYAYLQPALLAIGVLATAGIATLARGMPKNPTQLAGLGAFTVAISLVAIVPSNIRELDQGDAYAADEVARMTVAPLAPRTLALSSYFQTAFRLTALRASEGLRPDVAHFDRSFLGYPGETDSVLARYPELSALLEAGLAPGQPAPITELDAQASLRPVAIELHFNLDTGYHSRLEPAGGFGRYAGGGENGWRPFRGELTRIIERAGGGDREWAIMHLLWHDYVTLVHLCAAGAKDEATVLGALALEAAPGDEMLINTLQECGVGSAAAAPNGGL